MNCLVCGELVTLGVYAVEGDPAAGMICWPCHLKGDSPTSAGEKAWMAQVINNQSWFIREEE